MWGQIFTEIPHLSVSSQLSGASGTCHPSDYLSGGILQKVYKVQKKVFFQWLLAFKSATVVLFWFIFHLFYLPCLKLLQSSLCLNPPKVDKCFDRNIVFCSYSAGLWFLAKSLAINPSPQDTEIRKKSISIGIKYFISELLCSLCKDGGLPVNPDSPRICF